MACFWNNIHKVRSKSKDWKVKFEDNKWVIRSRISKGKQCNGQEKRTNIDLQNTTQKTKD